MHGNVRLTSLALAILPLFAACLLIGTANHLYSGLYFGWLWDYGYGDAPLGSRLFWAALTVLDPVVAVLLLVRPRIRIACAAILILVDVLHNSVYVAANHQWLETFYLGQVGFLLLSAALAPFAWAYSPGIKPSGVHTGSWRRCRSAPVRPALRRACRPRCRPAGRS